MRDHPGVVRPVEQRARHAFAARKRADLREVVAPSAKSILQIVKSTGRFRASGSRRQKMVPNSKPEVVPTIGRTHALGAFSFGDGQSSHVAIAPTASAAPPM